MEGLWTLEALEARKEEIEAESLSISLRTTRVEGQLAKAKRLKAEAEADIPMFRKEIDKLFSQMASVNAERDRNSRNIELFKTQILPMEKRVGDLE